MSKNALKSVLKISQEAYDQAFNDIMFTAKPRKIIYDNWFAIMYALEGIVDALCNDEEKLEYTKMFDNNYEKLQILLKL